MHRIALHGFSDFERDALGFCISNANQGGDGYRLVERLIDADLIVADSDAQQTVETVVREGRTPHVLFVGRHVPPGAEWHVSRPIDPVRILKRLAELVAERSAEPHRAADPSAMGTALPVLEDVVVPDSSGAPVSEPAVDVRPPSSRTERAAARAEARRATRRARLATAAAATQSEGRSNEVLVFDPDDAARDALCELLEGFGFRTEGASRLAQAHQLAATRSFDAVFLEIALDGSDGGAGIDLCRLIKGNERGTGGTYTPLLVVTARDANPADRVRAALAGVDAHLVKPLTRGKVAGTLESHGVALPADARKG